jgi:alpha-L-arabinofuranosidase
MAALSTDRTRLSIAVVNPGETALHLAIEVRGARLPGSGRVCTISAPDLRAENLAGRPPMIETVESPLTEPNGVHAAQPLSTNMYVLEIR